ncbi:MAG: branched-chain amino acid ABC transporter permease [Dolichospermum sp.]|jgi:branched-chain amino acid transport system permease protein|uniref:branched-chain amino acid ABC transporter permease n=1 Tax=Dolichospermum circinale TaxID=109265 RepID=UPI0004009ACC|nr:branched-chain amino acid ABC transporter permease [Dolichospermum circinale]MBD1211228.1 branched-chain amino acid ABC transporter permease [Dolichospermum circinale Clear-D4]MDB9452804.1 branched-chain amino acid ABC transporter permease [Dolichospermum circinale CS-541/06]MDB9463987.1 branched-chain amino acid ABC transporter permease [Dolichospermum circinale CS-541/04]MDB9475209.1 branched-chain amino acid ABC transporter permease [Dolichospermum circinale CS-537/11]MDB9479628.1 branch
MDFTVILQQLLNGLSIGSVYAIFALGYTLVYSILGIINLAHGAIFTLGAYFTYALMGGNFGFSGLLANAALPVKLPFTIALILGSIFAGLIGVIMERLAFKPLRRKGSDPLLTVVSSLGVAVVIVNLIQYLLGAESYTFPADTFGNLPAAINFGSAQHPIPIRTVQLIIFVVSLIVVSMITYFVNYTKYGKAMQAIAEDQITASLLGINTDKFIIITFFISSFLAGLAGTLVASSVSIAGPYFGIGFGLRGLAVIVLGGLGSIPGAVLGGLVIGIIEALVPGEYSGYKDAVAFGILFMMLLVRPQGLLGKKFIQKV